MTEGTQRANRLASAAAVAVLAGALAGCGGGGPKTMSLGKWTEGPMRTTGDALTTSLQAAEHGASSTSFRQTDCDALDHTVAQAKQKPRPNATDVADAWSRVLSSAGDAVGACRGNDLNAFGKDVLAIGRHLDEVKAAINAH